MANLFPDLLMNYLIKKKGYYLMRYFLVSEKDIEDLLNNKRILEALDNGGLRQKDWTLATIWENANDLSDVWLDKEKDKFYNLIL